MIRRTHWHFFTTPDGLRMDAAIQKDAVVTLPDQMPMNLNWNTFWDVLTRQDSTRMVTGTEDPDFKSEVPGTKRGSKNGNDD